MIPSTMHTLTRGDCVYRVVDGPEGPHLAVTAIQSISSKLVQITVAILFDDNRVRFTPEQFAARFKASPAEAVETYRQKCRQWRAALEARLVRIDADLAWSLTPAALTVPDRARKRAQP